jgi:hypothetical protein
MIQTIIRSTGAVFLGGALLFLTACGGGGGGSSGGGVAYDGTTKEAVLTRDNVRSLVGVAATGIDVTDQYVDFMTGVAFRGTASAGKDPALDSPLRAVKLLVPLVHDVLTPAGRTYRRTSVDQSRSGPCGGTVRVEGWQDDQTGDTQMSLSFDDYCDGGDSISGQIFVNAKLDLITESVVYINMNVILLKSEESGISTSGNIDISFNGSAMTSVVSMNMRNDNFDQTIRWDKFTTVFAGVEEGAQITVAGQAYHPAHGRVDVTTPTPFFIHFADEYPSIGMMLVRGASRTWARVSAASSSQCVLEADTTGDGTADYSELLFWDDL